MILRGDLRGRRRSSARPFARGLAERVGFEPTDLSVNGFQDRRNRPLCHLSAAEDTGLYGAADDVGPIRPFRSKIEAFPDGTSITVILSDNFWMYWYWRIWFESEAASDLLAVA